MIIFDDDERSRQFSGLVQAGRFFLLYGVVENTRFCTFLTSKMESGRQIVPAKKPLTLHNARALRNFVRKHNKNDFVLAADKG